MAFEMEKPSSFRMDIETTTINDRMNPTRSLVNLDVGGSIA
jgi:hypothetical protein